MLRHMQRSLRAELRHVLPELGQDVHRAVGGWALLEQAERDQGVEIVEQQVLVVVRRRVVEEGRGRWAGHRNGLLPGATGIHVGLRRVPPPSDGTKTPRTLRETPLIRTGLC